jgi:O-antigen/teichoic acid export membrane protein
MHEVGIYGVPYKILEILIAFPSMFVGSVFPLLSEYINTDKEKARHIFRKASSFMVLMAIPLVVGTLIMADEIILLISGPEFIASASVLRILIFSVAITFLSSLFSHTIISANLQKKLIFVMLCVSSFNVLANLIFIPRYSYFAAATVTVLSEMILLSLTLFIIIRYIKFKPAFSVFLRAFLASLFMGGVVFIARSQIIGIFSQGKLMQALGILIILVLGCLVYFPTAYLVKAISKEDVRKLMAR